MFLWLVGNTVESAARFFLFHPRLIGSYRAQPPKALKASHPVLTQGPNTYVPTFFDVRVPQLNLRLKSQVCCGNTQHTCSMPGIAANPLDQSQKKLSTILHPHPNRHFHPNLQHSKVVQILGRFHPALHQGSRQSSFSLFPSPSFPSLPSPSFPFVRCLGK